MCAHVCVHVPLDHLLHTRNQLSTAHGIAGAACWPFLSKPESRGLGGLKVYLVRPEALMGQPRKWEEMAVRAGSEENIASG